RPGLEGRACDDDHGCVEGFHCSDGVCTLGEPGEALDDGGAPPGRDGGDAVDDAGADGGAREPDGGDVLDGGEGPLECVDEPPPDVSWLASPFAANPPVVKPGGRVALSWYAPAMDAC